MLMRSTVAILLLLGCATLAGGQGQDVVIESEQLAENVYVLYGRGGNMMLFAGEERTFLVDDQIAPLSEKILAKIAELTDRPVDFVLNTHYHGDHTGGNENLGKAGAVTFAHEHTRAIMQEGRFNEVFERQDEAADPANLPIITFSEDLHFHIDGHEIEALHVPAAHTGGDSMVWIRSLNIVHMSDIFFNVAYPYVDVSSGGRLSGVLAACDAVLAVADEGTKIVPGHGRLADKTALQNYVDMLREFQAKARAALAAGESLDEFVAKKITAAYDDPWAEFWLTGDQMSRIVYLSEREDGHGGRSLDGERGHAID